MDRFNLALNATTSESRGYQNTVEVVEQLIYGLLFEML